MSFRVRDATAADAAACAAIYAPYVRDTSISFESEPPDEAEIARRIDDYARSHAWLVALKDDVVVGYAYASPHRAREAYRYSAEVSVYLDPSVQGGGVATALYRTLFERLGARGYRRAFAGITLPNEPSERFHRRFGFETVGTFRRVGWKQGQWRDVLWLQSDIGDPGAPAGGLR